MRIGNLLTTIFFLTSSQALAGVITYTSSTAFNAALAGPPSVAENYGAGFTAGEIIPPGSTFDGITYASFNLGTHGNSGIISNQFNGFSGLSLGADEDNGAAQFFFDGDSFVINFAPTYAIGVFFNVNANSGTFGITTAAGGASTGSASYDTSTFVFAGLISTTPFTSATIFSNSGGAGTASFNIPEILLSQAPEPASLTVTALGVALLATLLLRQKSRLAD
jgi:hypothetical protein